jgi:hypothetical protein
MSALPRGRHVFPPIDLWVIFVVALLVGAHGAASLAGVQESQRLSLGLAPFILIGLVVAPGFCLASIGALERFGPGALAGLTIALSLSLIAVIGTALWLAFGQFSAGLIELVVGEISNGLIASHWLRRRPAPACAGGPSVRWTALAILIIPAMVAMIAMNGRLPAAPATRYTEFEIAEVQHRTVTVRIVNEEAAAERYTLVGRRADDPTGEPMIHAEVTVEEGQQVGLPLSLDADSGDRFRLDLLRPGDQQAYRSLEITVP